MVDLTKLQKIIILTTIFWEIFAYNANFKSYRNRLDFTGFMLASTPVIIYWSVVWVWGFGVFKKLFSSLRHYVKHKINIKDCFKHLIYFILTAFLIYIANLNGLIDSKVLETTIGGLGAALIISLFIVPFNSKKNSSSKEKKKKTSNKFPIIFIILLILICSLTGMHGNVKQKRIKELNAEIKKAAIYVGWRFREIEFMYDFCNKNGYELKKYKNEFFKLAKNDENHLKQLYTKLNAEETKMFEKIMQQVKSATIPILEKEVQTEFDNFIIKHKNIKRKDLCKAIDDSAAEILKDRYENIIKRQYNGIYTNAELQLIEKVKKENNL